MPSMHDAVNKVTVLFSVVDDLIFKRRETNSKLCCTANFLQYVCYRPLCAVKERIRPVLPSLCSRVTIRRTRFLKRVVAPLQYTMQVINSLIMR